MPGDLSRWTGLETIEAEALLEELRPKAERAVVAAGIYFSGAIKRTLTGTRSGRAYRVSKRGPLHIASAPGEPPAVLFGNLRNSIGYSPPSWEDWTVTVEVGVGLGQPPKGPAKDPETTYARRLEWGGVDVRGVRILARPYMEPTRLREQARVEQILERESA